MKNRNINKSLDTMQKYILTTEDRLRGAGYSAVDVSNGELSWYGGRFFINGTPFFENKLEVRISAFTEFFEGLLESIYVAGDRLTKDLDDYLDRVGNK